MTAGVDDMHTITDNKGFTLVEVLVTLVILSVGLLGIAGLQASGLRFNSISAQRSLASIETSNFIAKMRANICGVNDTDPAVIAAGAGPAYSDCTTPTDDGFSYADKSSVLPTPAGTTAIVDPGNTCTTAGVKCTSNIQAQADMWSFATSVANRLKTGEITIICNKDAGGNCTNSSTYTVTVLWLETNAAIDNAGHVTGAEVQQSFTTVFRP